jgi:hypothetical protein
MNITENQAETLIRNSGGVILTVEFHKRKTFEYRKMLCRMGVRKNITGTGRSYSDTSAGVVTVWDVNKDNWRTVPLEGIFRIKYRGDTYTVIR